MKSSLTRTLLIISVALTLGPAASAEQLIGRIGSASGPSWQSSWIDLTNAINFKQGEKLKITVRGSADKVIVRLLPSGAHPSSSVGIVGNVMEVLKDGILQIKLPEERRNIVQVSVHGGQKAWDINLGAKNGPVTLICVERLAK